MYLHFHPLVILIMTGHSRLKLSPVFEHVFFSSLVQFKLFLLYKQDTVSLVVPILVNYIMVYLPPPPLQYTSNCIDEGLPSRLA